MPNLSTAEAVMISQLLLLALGVWFMVEIRRIRLCLEGKSRR
jgi:hypothetical protein